MSDTNRKGTAMTDPRSSVTVDAAIRDRDNRIDRDRVLAEKLRIEVYNIINIIDLSGSGDRSPHTGAYVVEFKSTAYGEIITVFGTVVDGQTKHHRFETRPVAILAALAQQVDGNATSEPAEVAYFAARTLGIPADAAY